MRRGTYVIYKGQEYRTGLWEKIPGIVRLSSLNEKDLDKGFYCVKSQEYMKLHGFRCQKEVPKSEITEVYKITPYANYKGFKLYIHGKKSDNMFTLLHTQIISSHSERDREIRDTLIEMGFYVFNVDKFGLTYAKDVPIDDPELETFEERTEIDISEL